MRWWLLALAVVVVGCGGKSERDRVDEYVKAANAVQASSDRSFAEANRSYASFVAHKLDDPTAVRGLGEAEVAIRATESRLARIPAPPSARALREKLLRLYRLDADLARETVLLAHYLPQRERTLAGVAAANRKLASGLKRAKQPPAQAAVLTDYRRRLQDALTAMRALQPPPVASALHHAQVKRLAASRKLAGRLRAAVRARDAKRTAQLVVAFRAVGDVQAGEQALQQHDLDAYAARRSALTLALADVKRERTRLERLK